MRKWSWTQKGTAGCLAVVLAAAGVFVVTRYVLPLFHSDETRVRLVVERAAEFARERHVNGLLSVVDDAYADERLVADKELLGDILRRMYLMYKRVRVDFLDEPAVTLDPANPDEAEATFRAVVLLGTSLQDEPADPMVQDARGTDFWRLRFRKDPRTGEWRVVATASK